jgi:hypothetical protein
MSVVRYLAGMVAGLIIILASFTPTYAQDMETRVIVPDVPGGALFTGCYQVQQRLYGPYRMTFCLDSAAPTQSVVAVCVATAVSPGMPAAVTSISSSSAPRAAMVWRGAPIA